MSELLEKFNDILGETSKELLLLKGKMYDIKENHTKTDGQLYYSFKIKTIKSSGSDDEYAAAFNTYFCIMGTDLSRLFKTSDILLLQNSEVILCANPKAMIRKLDNDVVVNNITLFVNDIMKVRNIETSSFNNNPIFNL